MSNPNRILASIEIRSSHRSRPISVRVYAHGGVRLMQDNDLVSASADQIGELRRVLNGLVAPPEPEDAPDA